MATIDKRPTDRPNKYTRTMQTIGYELYDECEKWVTINELTSKLHMFVCICAYKNCNESELVFS